jgi:peptidoglycan-N-acetylglucosamine deacetylase
MKYFIKTPWWLKKLYPKRLWSIDAKEKTVYLTFDDGPHPIATPFILDQLKKYNAKGTFFCIGKNVVTHPDIYKRILDEGHTVGNHTQDHLKGWKTNDDLYIDNVQQAAAHIHSDLFRPPYGRLRSSQAKKLAAYKIVMWDVLSGDFDESISKEKCLDNVLRKAKPGSIIVFHDSRKAFPRLAHALPVVLQHLKEANFEFKALGKE